MRLPVDTRVKEFVRQQVTDGVYNVAEMQRHSEAFVRNVLFAGKPLPSRLSRRFYPTRRDYTNINTLCTERA
jgi:Amyotrophic lateral sclerosis 2 chromosomal region candidate gene 8